MLASLLQSGCPLAAILGIQVRLDELRGTSNEWESRVSEMVARDDDLAKQIRELEETYDEELLNATGGEELREWLDEQDTPGG